MAIRVESEQPKAMQTVDLVTVELERRSDGPLDAPQSWEMNFTMESIDGVWPRRPLSQRYSESRNVYFDSMRLL